MELMYHAGSYKITLSHSSCASSFLVQEGAQAPFPAVFLWRLPVCSVAYWQRYREVKYMSPAVMIVPRVIADAELPYLLMLTSEPARSLQLTEFS